MRGYWAVAFPLLCSLLVSTSYAYLTLQRIPNAAEQGARCLDGSDAVYYMYRNTESTRWVVHLETGIASCLGPGAEFCSLLRNPTQGGTSEGAPCVLPEIQSDRLSDVGVLVSSDNTRNPEFFRDNRVFIPHCSADNFVGRNLNGSLYGGGLYFGGFNIVRAVVEDLLNNQGLYSASEVLFGGAGMGVVAHTDWLRGRLPNSVFLAVYTDGLGIPTFPTFTDLQPMINESISRGDQAEFINNFTVPTDLQNFNGIYSLYATLSALNPYIPERCANDDNFTFSGLECYDVPTGIRLGLASNIPVFMFASVWDTSVLASYLGLQRYTCASETGLLSEEERVYVTILGLNNYNRLQQTYEQRGSQIISILAANCFTYSFLEDELLCSRTGGRSPYEALQLFLAAAQISGESLTVLGITNPATLTCSEYCGASQCSWGGNMTRPADTPSSCGSRLDGFGRFRTGMACPGQVLPAFAQASVPASTITLFRTVNATARNAVCLDGSPAGYYVHRNLASPNWIIHVQGGGFCSSFQECQAQLGNGFGTSSVWACSLPGNDRDGRYAPLADTVSPFPRFNPEFSGWNRVYIRYCTQDFHLGQQPQASNPFGVNTVGAYGLQAALYDLQDFHGLLDGNVIILGGTSAGAVGVHSRIDEFRDRINSIRAQVGRAPATVLGYSDGGWFRRAPNLLDFANNPTTAFSNPENSTLITGLLTLFAGVYNAYHVPACQASRFAAFPLFGGHDCVNAEFLYPFIQTPMFTIANHWDLRELVPRIGTERFICASVTNRISSLERAFINQYGLYTESFTGVFTTDYDGFFFPTCLGHAHFEFAPELNIFPPCDAINGVSAYSAMTEWVRYRVANSSVQTRLFGSVPNGLQCDASCLATQCAWGRTEDTTNTSCPNLTPAQLEFNQYFQGQPCPDGPSSTVPPTPVTTPPGVLQACPEVEAALSNAERYRILQDCWSRVYSEYSRTFENYINNQCGSQ
ncbi:uncharacterized protein LOC135823757 [Sycon ciliatum]|uniref:uncharacterized protein LOC135823757 n=1 Tax=Sycon ciliatum TaxID=27933 RepID=UPI0031F61099